MKRSNLWWGIVLICAGALSLLNSLGVFASLSIAAGPPVFSLALVGLGAWALWATQRRPSFTTEALVCLEAAARPSGLRTTPTIKVDASCFGCHRRHLWGHFGLSAPPRNIAGR